MYWTQRKRYTCKSLRIRIIEKIYLHNIEEEGYNTEEDYPFKIEPNVSTLSSIIEIETGRGWQISCVQDDTLRGILGFKPSVIHDKSILSDNPVNKLSFDKNFVKTSKVRGWFFKGDERNKTQFYNGYWPRLYWKGKIPWRHKMVYDGK